MILEGKNAIAANRKIMGATNPKDAEENTPFDVASIYGQSEVVKFLLLIGNDRSLRCLI